MDELRERIEDVKQYLSMLPQQRSVTTLACELIATIEGRHSLVEMYYRRGDMDVDTAMPQKR